MGRSIVAPTSAYGYNYNGLVPSDADLDDYKSNGIWYISTNVANSPSGSSFLEVFSIGSIVIQRVQNRWTVFSRYYSSNTWKEWKSTTLA